MEARRRRAVSDVKGDFPASGSPQVRWATLGHRQVRRSDEAQQAVRSDPPGGNPVTAWPVEGRIRANPLRRRGAEVVPRREAAMIRRLLFVPVLTLALTVAGGGAAFACGGLVAPGHAEVLQKATTLVVWHAGFEHYITGFEFAGTASSFGYIIPLPGNPTKIQKG